MFVRGHVRRAKAIRIPALATLLYVDWLPQVNGPPGALLSSVVDHESAIIGGKVFGRAKTLEIAYLNQQR